MDKITHDVRLAQWAEVVKQCLSRPEGVSIKAWCRQNGVNEKIYFYWQRRVRKEVFNQATAITPLQSDDRTVSLVEIPKTALLSDENEIVPKTVTTPDAVIRTGSIEIEIRNSLSPLMLKSILEVAVHAR
jgi:hypothetical protein